MKSASKKILISAGESSGDEHAAHLVECLRELLPSGLEIRGLGGSKMRANGVDLALNFEDHGAVMGFAEVLFSAPRLIGTWHAMRALLTKWKPDLLVIVDYPDFNLALAKAAKKLDIPVFYYITPQLWAWRSGRVRAIAKRVNWAAVIFPFEEQFFRDRGYLGATFVGHPFCDELKRFNDAAAEEGYRNLFLISHDLEPTRPVLALFPGSRQQEIKRNIVPMLNAAREVQKRRPEVQVLISVVPAVAGLLEELKGELPAGIKLLSGKALDILRCADAGLLKSGTSNLQAAFYGLPFAMFYRTSALSEFIVRHVVKVREFSIVNVLRSGTVKEFLQDRNSPSVVADELESLLFDQTRRRELKTALGEVAQSLQFKETRENKSLSLIGKTSPARAAELAARLLP